MVKWGYSFRTDWAEMFYILKSKLGFTHKEILDLTLGQIDVYLKGMTKYVKREAKASKIKR